MSIPFLDEGQRFKNSWHESMGFGGSQLFDISQDYKQLKTEMSKFGVKGIHDRRSMERKDLFGIPVPETDRDDIKSNMRTIQNLWRDVSMGSDQISSSLLSSINENIGEIGSDLFRKIFLQKSGQAQVSVKEFWALWMKFLSNEVFSSDFLEDGSHLIDQGSYSEPNEMKSESGHIYDEETPFGCFDLIQSQYSSNRRLRLLFFEEQALVPANFSVCPTTQTLLF